MICYIALFITHILEHLLNKENKHKTIEQIKSAALHTTVNAISFENIHEMLVINGYDEQDIKDIYQVLGLEIPSFYETHTSLRKKLKLHTPISRMMKL